MCFGYCSYLKKLSQAGPVSHVKTITITAIDFQDELELVYVIEKVPTLYSQRNSTVLMLMNQLIMVEIIGVVRFFLMVKYDIQGNVWWQKTFVWSNVISR